MPGRITTFSRLGSAGQAAVESALTIPMSMFVVLGLLQMGMLQQARLLADYAAYRGTRAASVQRLECKNIKAAELAALVPALGRADDQSAWKSTFRRVAGNVSSGLPVLVNHWAVENIRTPFDKPLAPSEDPERVRIHLRFYYPMNIPFANWLLAKYFLASNAMQAWSGVDPTMATHKMNVTGTAPSDRVARQDYAIVKSYFDKKIYVAPISASWTMRMFSQGDFSGGTSGDCK